MHEKGYDHFSKCNANETLSLYSAKNASWKRVGILCPESSDLSYAQGGAPCVTKQDSSPVHSNRSIYVLKFNERPEVEKRVVSEFLCFSFAHRDGKEASVNHPTGGTCLARLNY